MIQGSHHFSPAPPHFFLSCSVRPGSPQHQSGPGSGDVRNMPVSLWLRKAKASFSFVLGADGGAASDCWPQALRPAQRGCPFSAVTAGQTQEALALSVRYPGLEVPRQSSGHRSPARTHPTWSPAGVCHPLSHLCPVLVWSQREAEWSCPGRLRGETASCPGQGGKGKPKICSLPRRAQLPREN